MSRLILLLFPLYFLFYLAGPLAHSATLKEAIDSALKNNQDLALNNMETIDAKNAANAAVLSFLPSVSLSLTQAVVDTGVKYVGGDPGFGSICTPGPNGFCTAANGSQGVMLAQNLTIYKMIPDLKAADHAMNAKKSQLREYEQNVTTTVIDLYFDLLRAKKNIVLADKDLAVASKKLLLAKAYNRNKLNSVMDLATAEADYVEANSKKHQSTIDWQKIQADYSRATGINNDVVVSLPDSKLGPLPYNKLSDFVTAVMVRNLQISAAISERKRDYYNKISGISSFLPDLTLRFRFDRVNNSPPFLITYLSYSFMFEMSWQLFDGGKTIYSAMNKRLKHKMSVLKETILKQKLEAEAVRSWEMHHTYEDILSAKEKLFFTSRQNLEKTKSLFRGGNVSEIDLLNAEKKLITSEIEMIRAKADYFRSYYLIMSLVDMNPFLQSKKNNKLS